MKVITKDNQQNVLLDHLYSATTIRERCQQVFAFVQQDQSPYFCYHSENLALVVDYVIQEIEQNYPDRKIPYHSRFRHFEVGNRNRWQELCHWNKGVDVLELGKQYFDLVTVSVLLDAGAGKDWYYQEQDSGKSFGRSEGLAVASFFLFCNGFFANDPDQPYRVDGEKLQQVTSSQLAKGFQVRQNNQLVGLDGRTELLNRLGKVLCQQPEYFGSPARIGNLLELCQKQSIAGCLLAPDLLKILLYCVCIDLAGSPFFRRIQI